MRIPVLAVSKQPKMHVLLYLNIANQTEIHARLEDTHVTCMLTSGQCPHCVVA